MSKLSFQYGLRVFLITPVVRVCSPLIVVTAKGSGNSSRHQHKFSRMRAATMSWNHSLKTSRLYRPSAAMTIGGLSALSAHLEGGVAAVRTIAYWSPEGLAARGAP
jgi:hypothetical protein